MNSVSTRISDILPIPEPSPVGSANGAALKNSQATAGEEVADAANLSPLSRLAQQATASDQQRVESLRKQFQSGQYVPDSLKTSGKMVAENLGNPLKP